MILLISSIVILIIFIFLLILLFLKFNFRVEYNSDFIFLKMKLFSRYFNIYSKEIEKKESQKSVEFKKIWGYFGKIKKTYKLEKDNFDLTLDKVQKNIDIYNYELFFRAGFGNAAVTGVSVGLIRGAVHAAHALVRRHLKLTGDAQIAVTPDFGKKIFAVNFAATMRFRVFNLLRVVFFVKKMYNLEKEKINKIWEGGDRDERASD